jgi:hypothetical protein
MVTTESKIQRVRQRMRDAVPERYSLRRPHNYCLQDYCSVFHRQGLTLVSDLMVIRDSSHTPESSHWQA